MSVKPGMSAPVRWAMALSLAMEMGCGGGSGDGDIVVPPPAEPCDAEKVALCQSLDKVCVEGECVYETAPALSMTVKDAVEGGMAAFSDGESNAVSLRVALNHRPSATVKVKLSLQGDEKAKIAFEASEVDAVEFSPDDWDARTIRVYGTDEDETNDGYRKVVLAAEAESGDAAFNGLSASIELVHEDLLNRNAECGFEESMSGETIRAYVDGLPMRAWFTDSEYGSFCVSLKKQPTAEVKLTYAKNDLVSFGEYGGGDGVLTFTPGNYDQPQCLRFRTAQSSGKPSIAPQSYGEMEKLFLRDVDGNVLTRMDVKGNGYMSQGVPLFKSAVFQVPATVQTDDECYAANLKGSVLSGVLMDKYGPWLELSTTSQTRLVEGDSLFFSNLIKLTGKPSGDVTVRMDALPLDARLEFTGDNPATITPENWRAGVRFKIRARLNNKADALAETPVRIFYYVSKSDAPEYAALVNQKDLGSNGVDAVIVDSDVQSLRVGNATKVTASMRSAEWDVSLAKRPESTVVVKATLKGPASGVTLDTTTFAFTASDYNTVQKVKLRFDEAKAWSDGLARASEPVTVEFTSDALKAPVTITVDKLWLDEKVIGFTGSYEKVWFPAGKYLLVAMGASSHRTGLAADSALNSDNLDTSPAGDVDCTYSQGEMRKGKGYGMGAMASGVLSLSKGAYGYVRVGGMGATRQETDGSFKGGYNGGGEGFGDGSGAGGSTDLSFCGEEDAKCTNEKDHNGYRVLVAAGAGGNGVWYTQTKTSVGDYSVATRTLVGGHGCDADSNDKECFGSWSQLAKGGKFNFYREYTYGYQPGENAQQCSGTVTYLDPSESLGGCFGLKAGDKQGGGGGGGMVGGLAGYSCTVDDTYDPKQYDAFSASGSGGRSYCFTGVDETYKMSGGKLADDTYALTECHSMRGRSPDWGDGLGISRAKSPNLKASWLHYRGVGTCENCPEMDSTDARGHRGNGVFFILPLE